MSISFGATQVLTEEEAAVKLAEHTIPCNWTTTIASEVKEVGVDLANTGYDYSRLMLYDPARGLISLPKDVEARLLGVIGYATENSVPNDDGTHSVRVAVTLGHPQELTQEQWEAMKDQGAKP